MRFENLVKLEVMCADIPAVLSGLNRMNVIIKKMKQTDLLTVCFVTNYKFLPAVRMIAEKYGGDVKITETQGIKKAFTIFHHRPILITCVMMIAFLALFLPTRVLFVETAGTQSVSSKYVIEKAAECGIRFGASRRKVRSEEVKNKLLSAIPQLHWAGVNTKGCVAVISVEEKSVADRNDMQEKHVGGIFASHDGVITSCTVQKGTPLCRVGQAVKEGELLVSGYVDCGLILQATCADAEITARTLRILKVISPTLNDIRGGIPHRSSKFSLQIGKKLINFFKDSGISGGSCVKMYSKKYLTLPGNHYLPIAVIIEQHMHYPYLTEQMDAVDSEHDVNLMSEKYLRSQMIAGEIIDAKTQISYENDYCCLVGTYSCTETIGRVKYEELTDIHG